MSIRLNLTRRQLLACGLAAPFALSPGLLLAQAAYPTKPVRIVTPFAAGGVGDTLARVIGEELAKRLGQPVVVESRAGANGIIGIDHVAKSAPDGYTMLYGITGVVQNASLFKKLPYDPFKDLQPISMIGLSGLAVVVSAASDIKSVKELLAAAKAGGMSYTSYGKGSTPHLYGELLAELAGAPITHIPYKGEGPALTDVIGQSRMIGLVSTGFAAAQQAGGRIRILAVTGTRRSGLLPAVPTLAEMGYPGFEAVGFAGLLFPAGVPKDVLDRVSMEMEAVLRMPSVGKRLNELGFDVAWASPEGFRKVMRADFERWDSLIKRAKIQPQ